MTGPVCARTMSGGFIQRVVQHVSFHALAAALLWAGPAAAQEGPAADSAEAAAATDRVIVTGSRIARTTFSAPSPVTVLGPGEIDQLQITNIGEGLSELPAFRASTNPSTNGFGSFNVGAQIVNLRGLGVTRNLVLVDGRRFAPTTREGSVDLNFVPSILVSRAEVVTGGASAAYGSDALAGVVNVILDSELEGFKGQVDFGISGEGDGENVHAGLAYGAGFANGSGHFVLGGEYSDQARVGNCLTRDWCEIGAVVTNTGYAAGNGQPQFIRADAGAGWYVSPAGVVSRFNNAAGAGSAIANSMGTGAVTFGPDGSVLPAQAGAFGFGLSQVGGDVFAPYQDVDMVAPVERYTVFGRAEYDFSDSLRGFVEANHGHVDGATFQAAYFSTSIPIFADNPFIPAELRTFVPPPPGPPSTTRPTAGAFNLGRVFRDVARGYSRSVADTYRVAGGLSGEFDNGMSWDAYYQYGRTDRLQTVDNNLVVGDPAQRLTVPSELAQSNARFFFAADAVTDPATGQPTCRALLSPDPAIRAAAAGCVPINLFGEGNVSAEGRDYIYDQLREDIDLQQHVIAANLRGETGDVLAGPLAYAVGAEYRVDKIDVVHDDLSNLFAYFQNFGADFNGKTEVVEGYVEAELPIVRGARFFNDLTVNGAVRVASYSISGFGSYLRTQSENDFDTTTWKISGFWEPVEGLRLRGTQSRDIRAPNFAELFLASASSFTPITNPFPGAVQGPPPSIVSGGSPTLRPEEADTTTVGLVLTPSGALEGLRFSVDAYRIKVNDYISTAPGGAQFLVNRCFDGVAEACAAVDRDPDTGRITQIRNVSLNLDYILAKGVDFEAEYTMPLGGENDLVLRGLATYVDTLKAVSFGDEVDRAGQTGTTAGVAAPDWLLNLFVTLRNPGYSVTLQGRFIDEGLYDAQRIGPDDPAYQTTLPDSINDNRVDSRFYMNLFGSMFVTDQVELFASVNNLLDADPPAAPETQFYTNPVYFDTIGRYFRVGARARF